MSGDAIDQARDAREKARQWDDCRRELGILEVQVGQHGVALQQGGLIPMHTDPEWILELIEAVNVESLR